MKKSPVWRRLLHATKTARRRKETQIDKKKLGSEEKKRWGGKYIISDRAPKEAEKTRWQVSN